MWILHFKSGDPPALLEATRGAIEAAPQRSGVVVCGAGSAGAAPPPLLRARALEAERALVVYEEAAVAAAAAGGRGPARGAPAEEALRCQWLLEHAQVGCRGGGKLYAWWC